MIRLTHNFRSALLFAGLIFISFSARAEGIQVESANTALDQTKYHLNANIRYNLPKTCIEALNSGVPLTLIVETEVLQKHDWMWNSVISETHLHYRLRYHALSETYQLSHAETGSRYNFWRLDSAFEKLGTIRDYPLIETDQLKPNTQYQGRIRVSLDIESLPLPLRSVAYLTPAWHISSDWYEWDIQPFSGDSK